MACQAAKARGVPLDTERAKTSHDNDARWRRRRLRCAPKRAAASGPAPARVLVLLPAQRPGRGLPACTSARHVLARAGPRVGPLAACVRPSARAQAPSESYVDRSFATHALACVCRLMFPTAHTPDRAVRGPRVGVAPPCGACVYSLWQGCRWPGRASSTWRSAPVLARCPLLTQIVLRESGRCLPRAALQPLCPSPRWLACAQARERDPALSPCVPHFTPVHAVRTVAQLALC